MTAARALIEEAITATLARKGITAPLGKPVPTLLRKKVAQTAQPRQDATVQDLQAKIDRLSLAQVGAITRLTSRYLKGRHDTDQQDPVTQLLYYGIEAFLDTAAEIGRLYDPSLSASTQQRVMATNRDVFDRVMDGYRERLEDRMLGVINGELGQQVEHLEREYNRAIDEAREQGTHAADQAQVELTEQRRLLDAASAQLTREREAHAREVRRLTGLLESERRATVERDRTVRNDLHQLRQDLASARTVIASLNAECERLELALATASAPQPTEEVPPMPLLSPTPSPQSALERASLCVFLRDQRQRGDVRWDPAGVFGQGRHIPLADIRAWRAAYPTPAAQLAQLRAVVRGVLGRAA